MVYSAGFHLSFGIAGLTTVPRFMVAWEFFGDNPLGVGNFFPAGIFLVGGNGALVMAVRSGFLVALAMGVSPLGERSDTLAEDCSVDFHCRDLT